MKARITVLNKISKGLLVSAALLLEHFPGFAVRRVVRGGGAYPLLSSDVLQRAPCPAARLDAAQPWEL